MAGEIGLWIYGGWEVNNMLNKIKKCFTEDLNPEDYSKDDPRRQKRKWIINCSQNGFKFKIIVNCGELYLREFMKTEMPFAKSYSGATSAEVSAYKALKLPIYEYKA